MSGQGAQNSGRFSEAAQHPVTLGFLSLGGLGVILLAGISPFPLGRMWGALCCCLAPLAPQVRFVGFIPSATARPIPFNPES
jgi:hypothetical protein